MSRAYDLLAPVLGVGIAGALLCVLIFLSIGRLREYWVIFVYAAWELLATAGLTVADVLYHGTAPSSGNTQTAANLWYARLYWTNDVLVDLFRFVLVIILLHRASGDRRLVSGRMLAGLVLVMIVLPFVLFPFHTRVVPVDPLKMPFPPATWLNSTSQLLNFGAAIMNLMLWATLIASKRRDPQLLQVSIGIGIVVTGTAVSYGVRHFFNQRDFSAVGFLLMNLTQLAGWLIWCRAFWPTSKPRSMAEAHVTSQ
jgi:hypothetical protein